jgi:hypothetical protein
MADNLVSIEDAEQLPLWEDKPQTENGSGKSNKAHAVPRPVDRLWTITDVGRYLDVPVATIYQWRVRGEGPPATKMGKHLRYEPAVVRAWVGEHRERA